MSQVDHEIFFLLQLTILAALKVTPAKAKNIIFVTSVRARAGAPKYPPQISPQISP
jgi:hypothetical protein